MEGFKNASRFRDVTRSKNLLKKLATPKLRKIQGPRKLISHLNTDWLEFEAVNPEFGKKVQFPVGDPEPCISVYQQQQSFIHVAPCAGTHLQITRGRDAVPRGLGAGGSEGSESGQAEDQKKGQAFFLRFLINEKDKAGVPMCL